MKRSWNPLIWAGFVLCLAALISYPTFFIRYPITRDFPWVNLLLIAVALILLVTGILRAFRHPEAYRGKIFGSILGVLSVFLVGFFLYGIFVLTKNLPASHGSPQVGQLVPDFTLPDSTGSTVTLSNLLQSPFPTGLQPSAGAALGQTAAVVLVFYRGYW